MVRTFHDGPLLPSPLMAYGLGVNMNRVRPNKHGPPIHKQISMCSLRVFALTSMFVFLFLDKLKFGREELPFESVTIIPLDMAHPALE